MKVINFTAQQRDEINQSFSAAGIDPHLVMYRDNGIFEILGSLSHDDDRVWDEEGEIDARFLERGYEYRVVAVLPQHDKVVVWINQTTRQQRIHRILGQFLHDVGVWSTKITDEVYTMLNDPANSVDGEDLIEWGQTVLPEIQMGTLVFHLITDILGQKVSVDEKSTAVPPEWLQDGEEE